MIPSKIEVLRKSYSPRVLELLKLVGVILGSVTISEPISTWRLAVKSPFVSNEIERCQVTRELTGLGWGCQFQYTTDGDETLVIYVGIP